MVPGLLRPPPLLLPVLPLLLLLVLSPLLLLPRASAPGAHAPR